MSEQEREETSPGATRSQHVVLHGPADMRMMTAAMRPGIERSRDGGETAAPACLVITPTSDQAMTAADQARRLMDNPDARIVPVTGAVRARRVLAAGPVAIVTGSANDLLTLRRDAALSLEKLQVVVIIGLDDILAANGAETLQTLLGDAPDDVARVATLDVDTPDTDTFLEAQLRRARRLTPLVIGDTPLAVTPRFMLTSAAGRADALRAVLDESDPPSLVVIAASDSGIVDATAALARLGLAVDGLSVQVTRQPSAQHVSMAVLWDAPATHDALVEALAMRPVDAVALLLPEELPAFRRMTGGTAEAWTPVQKKVAADDRVLQLRTALRSTLSNGNATASELALLAPLLETHDALEIASAALRLYEGARREAQSARAKASAAGAKPTAPRETTRSTDGAPASGRQRVFLAVGKRDNVRVGDIVGAIANEAGIPGEKIGQVELFESHAIAELASDDAAKVVAALADTSLRGRRLNARIDERGDRPERGGFGDRPPRSGGFGDRSPRSGGGGGFGGRSERPARSFDRGDRGGERGGERSSERPARSFDRGERSERPARSFDRGERSERPARSFDRGDRGAERGGERPARSFDRGDRGADRGGDRGGDRGPRSSFGGPPRSGGFGGGGGGGRPPRASDERRAFGDRPVRERAEGRAEWAERADRMKHAKRERPARPDFERGPEA